MGFRELLMGGALGLLATNQLFASPCHALLMGSPPLLLNDRPRAKATRAIEGLQTRIRNFAERVNKKITLGLDIEIRPDAFVNFLPYYDMVALWNQLSRLQKIQAWRMWRDIHSDFEGYFVDRFGDAAELAPFVTEFSVAQLEAMTMDERAVVTPFEVLDPDDQARLGAITVGILNGGKEKLKILPELKSGAPEFLRAFILKIDGSDRDGYVYELALKQENIFAIESTLTNYYTLVHHLGELSDYFENDFNETQPLSFRPHFHVGVLPSLNSDGESFDWYDPHMAREVERLRGQEIVEKINNLLLLERLTRIPQNNYHPLMLNSEHTLHVRYQSSVVARGIMRLLQLDAKGLSEFNPTYLHVELRDPFADAITMLEWLLRNLALDGSEYMKKRAQEIFANNPSVSFRLRTANSGDVWPFTKMCLRWNWQTRHSPE